MILADYGTLIVGHSLELYQLGDECSMGDVTSNRQYRKMFDKCIQVTTVTRFGEVSPLWQNVKKTNFILKGVFSFRQNFELIWAKFICYWENFHYCKCPNNK